MGQWVRLCGAGEAPSPGNVAEFTPQGVALCVANSQGELAAVDNVCPHRAGPLSEGWLEDGKVVCPWHAWAFDLKSGECLEERSQVKVYAVRREGDEVFVEID